MLTPLNILWTSFVVNLHIQEGEQAVSMEFLANIQKLLYFYFHWVLLSLESRGHRMDLNKPGSVTHPQQAN